MAYIEEPQVKYRQHIDNNIGSKKRSDEIEVFEQMRELFIDVKIDHFQIFMKNAEKFNDEKIKNLNKVCYEYFVNVKSVKKLNIKNIKLFWSLYKYEKLGYSLQNYLILNFPVLAKPLFYLKKGLKRN